MKTSEKIHWGITAGLIGVVIYQQWRSHKLSNFFDRSLDIMWEHLDDHYQEITDRQFESIIENLEEG